MALRTTNAHALQDLALMVIAHRHPVQMPLGNGLLTLWALAMSEHRFASCLESQPPGSGTGGRSHCDSSPTGLAAPPRIFIFVHKLFHVKHPSAPNDLPAPPPFTPAPRIPF